MNVSYIITNGNDYLSDGLQISTNKFNAKRWTKEKSAENYLKDIILKLKKQYKHKNWRVIKLETQTQPTITSHIEPTLDFDLKTETDAMMTKIAKLEKRQEYLFEQIGYFDKKIVDIHHCAEFYKLDIQRGYKLYKILHETTNKRRDAKNERDCIVTLLGKKLTSNDLESVSNHIEYMYGENRQYSPRVVDELFDLLK